MKPIAIKRILAFLLTLVFAISSLCVSSVSAEDADITSGLSPLDKTEGYRLVGEDGGLKLYLDTKTTNFYVEDVNTGKKTFAFPENVENNEVLTQAQKVEIQSALMFTFWDTKRKTENIKYSDGVSVKQGNYKVFSVNNGFIIKYELKSQKISICLLVSLKDGKLVCSIPAGSIVEEAPEEQLLLNVAVLPFMIRGEGDTEGNIVIPDGSGELLNFELTKASEASYSKPIYGRNLSNALTIEPKTGYDITCPYLAFENGEKGVLAIPTKGAGVGYVNANPAGKTTPYANAYFGFVYRASDIAIIGDQKSSISQSTRVFDDCVYDDDITITYQFIHENSSLPALAMLYGEYLAPGSKANEKMQTNVVFDIYGYVNERKNLLGIPYTTVGVLSSGEDIVALAEDTKFSDITINLKSVTKAHQNQKAETSVQPIAKVLSSSNMKTLLASNANVYISANPISFKSGSLWANSFFGASKTIYGAPVGVYEYRESTHLANKNVSKSLMLKPNKLEKGVQKILNSAKKLGVDGISSEELAAVSYHDYSGEETLVDTHAVQEKAVSKAAEQGGLILSNPFDYAIKYCSAVTDIPISGSNNDLCSGSYPFLQIALGNDFSYSVESINLNRSPEKVFLMALATGSILHYDYILTNTEPISGTELNFLYSADYKSFQEMTERHYNAFCEVRKIAENSLIKDYCKVGNYVTTVFENGAVLTIDFTENTYSITK